MKMTLDGVITDISATRRSGQAVQRCDVNADGETSVAASLLGYQEKMQYQAVETPGPLQREWPCHHDILTGVR
ncbi:hypothetical protein [Erwinia psidii]|uniref:Uncharacterized protein n=1 Tax=Erwinia psidii TaxID=69224 RepID=A0A3N6UZ61_9GAMM|nr:hypothetical protein [Erwinia psidii]MCX8958176.1 hypothetical protein [Erwinia psidii]MCX8963145.1 hypothetical protein [Erwinia psidii]MCX8966913.1 hypothetical protein [Erwinia psidii]RQM38095.1 hypothetical protein EB241_12535 [Erwinia psidii]